MRPRYRSLTTSGRFPSHTSPREIRSARSNGSHGTRHLSKCKLNKSWPCFRHFHAPISPIFSTVPAGTQWTKFNVGQYGYYRVQYPLQEWQQFGELMQNDMVRKGLTLIRPNPLSCIYAMVGVFNKVVSRLRELASCGMWIERVGRRELRNLGAFLWPCPVHHL